MPNYLEWAVKHYPTSQACYACCKQATDRMIIEFPELKQVRGWYHCPIWGRRTHWWCVDPDGQIVDPTVRQFPSHAIAHESFYEEYIDQPIPTGRCLECGELLYHGATVCSDTCYSAFARSLM